MSMLRRRRAIMLVELVSILIPAAILLGLMAMMTADFVTLQRLAGEHASRMAAADSLIGRMREDITCAGRAGWARESAGEGVLTLTLPGHVAVAYRIEAGRITRITGGAEDNVWSAGRLRFECDSVEGRTGRLLRLSLIELPPPRNSLLPARRFATTFVLPPGRGDADGDRR